MPETSTVRLDNRDVPYVVVRSARARLLRLRVGPEPVVTIIVPARYRLGRIHHVLLPHRRWIFKHLDRLEATYPSSQVPRNGDILPYLGVDRTLEVRSDERRQAVVLAAARIVVCAPNPGEAAGRLEYWYREQARSHLTARADALAAVMQVTYRRITIRDQRTRWGSCSSRGNLNFSWRLIMAPPEVADYVVIHELAHLAVPNHSRAFWDLVETHCPDRNRHQRWLRDNGERLAAFLN